MKKVIRTVPHKCDNDEQELIKELTRMLFFAAGRTGGTFKIEKSGADRYEAGAGDVHIYVQEDTRENGDVYITITRDRITAAGTQKYE